MATREIATGFSLEDDSIRRRPEVNIGNVERFATAIAGSAIIYLGARSLSLKSLPLLFLGAALLQRGASGHCPIYQKLDVDRSTNLLSEANENQPVKGITVEESVTIMKSPEEIYNFWRYFPNLSQFMRHLKKVDFIDDKRSRWTVEAPFGLHISWEAEVMSDLRCRSISWRSVPGALVNSTGFVSFIELPQNRGTEVQVQLNYEPPLGKVGQAFARLFGDDPSTAIREDLRSLRALLETGEIPFSEARPKARSQNEAEKMASRRLAS